MTIKNLLENIICKVAKDYFLVGNIARDMDAMAGFTNLSRAYTSMPDSKAKEYLLCVLYSQDSDTWLKDLHEVFFESRRLTEWDRLEMLVFLWARRSHTQFRTIILEDDRIHNSPIFAEFLRLPLWDEVYRPQETERQWPKSQDRISTLFLGSTSRPHPLAVAYAYQTMWLGCKDDSDRKRVLADIMLESREPTMQLAGLLLSGDCLDDKLCRVIQTVGNEAEEPAVRMLAESVLKMHHGSIH
ncbi:MAG: hypothetical protein HYV63_04640 [Candidatus Schekmanbacteria bacterium]|nr:hypothetical protein [Candidatus Schekmanbacteria bacterium]